jgi:hypothetical protein
MVHNKPVTLPGMYGSPSAREALKRLRMRTARIFMRCQDAHPEPGVFDWEFLDAAYPVQTLTADGGVFEVTCPSYSVTVIRCAEGGK